VTDAELLRKHGWVSVRVGDAQCWTHPTIAETCSWAFAMSTLAHGLESDLESGVSTCSKLHDLNHMQAQRIEALEARLKSAGTSLYDTRNFDAMSDALNVALTQCETRAKRIYELEQERIALCEGNKRLAQRVTQLEAHNDMIGLVIKEPGQ
jgi:hypothetical protein